MASGKKKKKLRVPMRKNRGKKPRQKNVVEDPTDDATLDDLRSRERISGKGALTRHRTIIAEEVETDAGKQYVVEVDEEKCRPGRVLRAIGSNSCLVRDEETGEVTTCTVRRVLRTLSRDARNAVVAGDYVLYQTSGEDEGVIERVEPRTGVLSRTAYRQEHIIVSNVDQAVIVASADEPPLKPALIDRFLVICEKNEIDAIICINKIDLIDTTTIQPIVGLYAQLGYTVVLTSTTGDEGTTKNEGVTTLLQHLEGKTTVFAGQSGVGKSSLLNAVQPQWDLLTNAVAADSGKGRHTTRTAQLFQLDAGGWVVDTPGIRQLDLWDVIPEEVEGYFIEFRPFVRDCKFPDCSHTHESNCGIKQAVLDGLISELRYQSFLRLTEPDTNRKRPTEDFDA